MFRYAVVGVLGLVASNAWAQQAPPPAGVPAPASSPASTPPKAVVPMEEPQPGDHWTYEVRDEITGTVSATRENVITEVTPKDISMRFKIVGTTNGGMNIYDRSWNLLSSGSWRYSPNDGSTGIRAPLTVGKTWTFQSNNVNSANGSVWKLSGTSKVVSEEAVTTKAGTFDTFKIETTFSTRNVNDPNGKSEMTSQTWYAPAIDHWVKRIFVSRTDKHLRQNNTFELTEYGRKQ
jgi:hypothetical protein